MKSFNLFRLECFVINEGIQEEKTAYINPAFVVSIEQYNGLTRIITSKEDYYTPFIPELIIKGLKDIQKLNDNMVLMN